jgi:hypothetical protein
MATLLCLVHGTILEICCYASVLLPLQVCRALLERGGGQAARRQVVIGVIVTRGEAMLRPELLSRQLVALAATYWALTVSLAIWHRTVNSSEPSNGAIE